MNGFRIVGLVEANGNKRVFLSLFDWKNRFNARIRNIRAYCNIIYGYSEEGGMTYFCRQE